jgi:hypothetical protein
MTLQVGTQVHPITVISMPGKDNVAKATTCLIDQCCTGSGMIASAFARILGIESTPTTPREFSTANGTLTTTTEVRIEGAQLPGLSRRREFKLTLQIVPDTVSLNYSIVLGLDTMKQIDLDTSVRNETISWSNELLTPMVPQSFWSKERIAKLIESTSHKESKDSSNGHNDPSDANSDGNLTNSELFATEFKPHDYERPDLTAVVAKNMYLNNNQCSQLLAVLQKNEHIFVGIKGTYTGPPVDIKLKPNAIPVWNQPYPIPLSQREAVENEVEKQCQVGALRRLSPEEIKGREWCFPAFSVPKKNGKIHFVINSQRINNQLEQREYPLTPAEEIFHSIGGFTWATSLILNMGYLHIRLSQASQELLTMVMPFGAEF